ncbi:succinate dehydrogenase, hydrophobic membrane anchor protein [Mesorhizobium sp. 2RAF21]|uniref:succinate dehydrogenase, hydrophobic membrane anchor protein n=1 Tax=Mesorhizobium sp. 2RAF21 TaxID=3232995 RepID=UPI003F9CBB1D
MKPMRSGLARARGLGSAKGGTEEFWRQRVTSVLGLPIVIGLMAAFWLLAGADYSSARRLVGNPIVAVVVALALLNFAVHMRLGAQVIIEDYIHRPVLKPFLLMANIGIAYGAATVAILALVKLSAFG